MLRDLVNEECGNEAHVVCRAPESPLACLPSLSGGPFAAWLAIEMSDGVSAGRLLTLAEADELHKRLGELVAACRFAQRK